MEQQTLFHQRRERSPWRRGMRPRTLEEFAGQTPSAGPGQGAAAG